MNPPLNVSVGENVLTGDTLGFNGNSGCAVDAHLHFEIRKGNWYFNSTDPWAIDPYGWWGSFTDPIEQVRDNRSDWLWISSDLIDDGDNGFQRYQGPNWSYFNFGYDNDSWIIHKCDFPYGNWIFELIPRNFSLHRNQASGFWLQTKGTVL